MLLSAGALALWTVEGFTSLSSGLPSRLSAGKAISGVTTQSTSTCLYMGKLRKARREQDRELKKIKGRDDRFREAMEALEEKEKLPKEPDDRRKGMQEPNPLGTNPAAADMKERVESRPDLTYIFEDEETGYTMVEQGRNVMNVITREAIKLSDQGPEYRLAQMFPGVPMDIRSKHRYNWATCEVPDMIAQFREACMVTLEDGTRGYPVRPSISNTAIDFVLSNRDIMGNRFRRTVGKLMLRAAWKENVEKMRDYRNLLLSFFIAENYISAPFRQMIMDGEIRTGPNFGNLDMMSYCGGDLYQRSASYIILKGMQCTWEQKVRDAEKIEEIDRINLANKDKKKKKISTLRIGDPRRFEPGSTVIYKLNECLQVCTMTQKMVKAFVENPALFNDLPVELRFLEAALSIKGGTALRKFTTNEFCPAEEITPEALREGIRRLVEQLDSMYADPYGDIRATVDKLAKAMAVGTDDYRNPYDPYLTGLGKDAPGFFQTYTFDHHPISLVKFLDEAQFDRERVLAELEAEEEEPSVLDEIIEKVGPKKELVREVLSASMQLPDDYEYETPEERAAGRPHNLGWLDLLTAESDKDPSFQEMKPGRIIFED